ncbi:serine/threonine-protein kinase [Nocardia sp. NBC_01327]|uniref:serine/threonine-protein kinase n=1 Tax=Nocardia sp. NBC_01327 TaxID=2903593 RepID=UPI002E10B052|nr:serine/threonine protein kinase [Nocardia sp. NBC_01327]
MARTLAQGQTFAGYVIERLLGVGGMGEVYLARDRDLPRSVALKLLSPAVADDAEVRARFLREADTAARLAHPNIVAVYARGRDEDRLWMAMQYIEGTDVAAALRDGPMRPDHAVRILGETARALDHAHRAGVLHRDVKPANILLAWGPEQRVFLADFGIAKALDQTSALTRTGEMYASFQYASPEQFELRTDMDQRADVYALGCTLFHMLTGALPYPGPTTAQLINGHLNGQIPRPSELNPAVPTAFDEVIACALAKDRTQRYGTCGELAAAAAHALTATNRGGAPWTPPVSAPRLAVVEGAGTTQHPRTAYGQTTQHNAAPLQYGPAVTQLAPGGFRQDGSGPSPAVHEVPSTPRPRRKGRKRLIVAGLLAAIVVAGIGVGFGSGALRFTIGAGAGAGPGALVPGVTQTDASRDAATKAACDYGILMTTYDYTDGDGWQAKVENGATGTWKSQAQQLLPAIRLLLESDSEHTRGTDSKCTVTSGNTTHYELAVDITQVNSTKGKADTTDHQNVTMSMDYVDGKWLCSKWVSPLFPS